METNNQVDKNKHMIVKVKKDRIHGMIRYYPANKLARLAVDLAKTKQVTDGMIQCLKDYGYTVQVVSETETL